VCIDFSFFLSFFFEDWRDIKGKDAAILADVVHIIDSTPDGVSTKAEEASLWLCAVSTGARSVTCAAVALRDIALVKDLDDGQTLVQIRYMRTKAITNWNHTVSLEGKLGEKSSANVVFWLDAHLAKTFGLHLRDYSHWNLTPEIGARKLWRWSKDAMSAMFRRRAESAGFPKGLLSFHSLRAGFICSALIQAGTNKDAVASVLENTAFVGGWVPNQKAQLRYVKNTAKRLIVSTRLILPQSGIFATLHSTTIVVALTLDVWPIFLYSEKNVRGGEPYDFAVLP
jgi:hypothetical protein